MTTFWAAEWHEKTKLEGEKRHIIYDNCIPALFHTRQEAREFIKVKYGYIKEREDLRQEPHGWRYPQAVRVKIEVVK